MGLVDVWTGRTACALQAALRLSNQSFARRLDVGVRTVAGWHEKPDLTPRSQIQEALDTVLEQASKDVKARFAEYITAFTDSPAEEPAANTSAVALSDVQVAGDPAERAWQQLVQSSGEVIELALEVTLDIREDSWARVTYLRELANLGSRPMPRLTCELWFEHTQGPLKITPIESGGRRITIQRIHDTPGRAQFACLISPPIRPGESAIVGYACDGCRFVSDHYWRQTMARHTRQFRLHLRHHGAAGLMNYTATEEHPGGTENSATEALEWDERDGMVDLRLTRQYLRPEQAVTLRWEVSGARS